MARKAKAKQTEAPQVNIGKEIFESLRELEKLKGIPVDYMVDRLKQALTNAYRKDREDHRDVPAEKAAPRRSGSLYPPGGSTPQALPETFCRKNPILPKDTAKALPVFAAAAGRLTGPDPLGLPQPALPSGSGQRCN